MRIFATEKRSPQLKPIKIMEEKLQIQWAKRLSILFIAVFASFTLQAQSGTYEAVYTIFQETGCANSGCHNSTTAAANLDLSGTISEVYNNIIDVAPDNAYAAAKGEKLVAPGYPYRSFLFRKLGHLVCDDIDCGLADEEGAAMPAYGGTPSPKFKPKPFVNGYMKVRH